MRMFSKLFRKSPGRDEWLGITSRIAKEIERIGKDWFETCVMLFEQLSQSDPKAQQQVVQRSLGGKGELAIKAFLLFSTNVLIATHSYIPRSEGRDFVDLLFAQVSGTRGDEVIKYLRRYEEVATDSRMLSRFTMDVASYIFDDDNAVMEGLTIAATYPYYSTVIAMVVAAAFEDEVTFRELESRVNNIPLISPLAK